MDERCRFCCKPPDVIRPSRLASGTVPPIDEVTQVEIRHEAVFKKYPPQHVVAAIGYSRPVVPTIVRNEQVFEIYRWACTKNPGDKCCECCRPSNAILPWELTKVEAEQVIDGLVIVVE